MYLAPSLGEVLAGRLGLVHRGLGPFGLFPFADDLTCRGKLAAELLSAWIGLRRKLPPGSRAAPQGTRQTRSQSESTGQEREGSAHGVDATLPPLPA
jgi:hypothetical protein